MTHTNDAQTVQTCQTRSVCKPGRNKTPFCVLEDELLSASDELLRETGQPHHVVRSLNLAKVAIALPQTS